MAGEGPNGNILIGLPRAFRQNAGAVKADVYRERNLMCSVLETVEFEQHLPGDAAFRSNRREYVRHSFFSPLEF